MLNRKIKSARLHTPLYIDGVGELGPSLPSKTKTVLGFAMVAIEQGIKIYGANQEGFVPWSNVQSVTFEQESKVKKVSSAA